MPLSTPIIQLLDRDAVGIDVGEPVSAAVRILAAGRFHHLPVLDDGRLVGMLTTNDVLLMQAKVAGSDSPQSLELIDRHYTIGDVMSKDIISLSDRATVGDAARQLSAGGFHSLPVVDRSDKLVGILTTTDLIAHMLEAPPKLEMAGDVRQRLQALERVRKAAEAFLHSGMASTEHQKLERALQAARGADTDLGL